MDKRRLVILTGSYPDIFCGISGHVKLIAGGIVAAGGYEVGVVTSDDPLVRQETAKGYWVYPVIKNWGLTGAYRICREVIKREPEIVHIQNPTVKYTGLHSGIMSLVAPMLKKWRPEIRIVVTQHDIAIGAPVFRWRYQPLLATADAVLVSNQRDYQAVADQGISPNKIYHAPVSAHFQMHERTEVEKNKARRAFDIPQDTVCVAYFGFVHPGRRIEVLIRALSILNRRRKIHGIIMGQAYPQAEAYYHQCRQLGEQLGLEDHLTWTGYATSEQVADGLAAADVFVSLLERGADLRNTSVISAILAQLPVVTTCNGRYYRDPELDRMGCRYVPGDDPLAVAAGIEDMVHNPPSIDTRAVWAKQLEPDAIWAKHMAVTLRAYRGEPPLIVKNGKLA